MTSRHRSRGAWRILLCLVSLTACAGANAQGSSSPPADIPKALLKLVAPIALYPDPLVAQILPASTFPMQITEAADSVAHGGRPPEATASQWDPSVQALVSFPSVLKMMSDKISWTAQLGQAVKTSETNVMLAIQQVRNQAMAAGNLQSGSQQTVTVQGSGAGSTIIIQPTNPEVIYVPQYDPVAILAPVPAGYYGYAPYGMMTFGAGFVAGAATAYACNWGYGSVTVNNYYHYSSTNSYAAYHPNTGAYTGYDAKTGTYGAYNPNTGKYATYNPSTGAYNKDGTTGTWTGKSTTGEYHANTGTYTGQNTKTGTYGAYNPNTGKYATYNPSTGAYNKDGSTGTWSKPSSTSGDGSWGSNAETQHSGGWGDGSRSGGAGAGFQGLDGGGWGAREASDRGAASTGGDRFGGGERSFGGGGLDGGGGFGGVRGGGFGGGGFRGGGFRR